MKNIGLLLLFSQQAFHQLAAVGRQGQSADILAQAAAQIDKLGLLQRHHLATNLTGPIQADLRKRLKSGTKPLAALTGVAGKTFHQSLPQRKAGNDTVCVFIIEVVQNNCFGILLLHKTTLKFPCYKCHKGSQSPDGDGPDLV